MFCSRCGCQVSGMKFCPNCGNLVEQVNTPINNNQINQGLLINQPVQSLYYSYQNIPLQPPNTPVKKSNQIVVGVCIACVAIIIAVAYSIFTTSDDSIYFSDDNNVNSNDDNIIADDNGKQTPVKPGVTSISHDNVYTIYVPTTEQSVMEMVEKDSEQEKEGCSTEIIEIENRIVNNYEIDAVNLCELDLDFALELEKIVKYVYYEFPNARGYLSHLSLGNLDRDGSIAFFQMYTPFTQSTQDSNVGYKSRIILNSDYYLDINKFQYTMRSSSNSGHFPKNSTIYSPLLHEFAHYLSFIATNNYYKTKPRVVLKETDLYESFYLAMLDFANGTHSKRMVEEAYNNYKFKTGSTISFDDFRASISQYAVAKDNSGNYIYDETIAEAFHDVYLNGDNAAAASKEIFAVVKKYVEM